MHEIIDLKQQEPLEQKTYKSQMYTFLHQSVSILLTFGHIVAQVWTSWKERSNCAFDKASADGALS